MIDQIFTKLKEENNKILDIYNSGNCWVYEATTIIKKTISDIAHDNGYSVATHYLECADEGEWLLDLTVHKLKYNGDFTQIQSIPLVVESEFSKTTFGGFKEDFDKLFIATSSERLFIMRINNCKELEKIKTYGQESVNNFEAFLSGDMIHFIYWDEKIEKNFKHLKFVKE